MFEFLKRKKKIESKPMEQWQCKKSPHDDRDLFWDKYGVYKKVYINRFDKQEQIEHEIFEGWKNRRTKGDK